MEAYKNTKVIGNLIHSGFYDKLVLIGFPYDEGAKITNLRVGSAYGPDCFRRFLHKLGPIQNAEFGIDLSKLTICDYGNISASTIPERYEKLRTKVRLTMERGQTTFVIGGSRDLIPFCSDAIIKHAVYPLEKLKPEEIKEIKDNKDIKLHKVLYICISPNIDVDETLPKNSSKSCWRSLFQNEDFNKSGSKVIFFGTSPMCEKDSVDYVKGQIAEIIWLNDIRKFDFKSDPKIASQTIAGKIFEKLLIEKGMEYESIYLSFNMEAIIVFLWMRDNYF